MKTTVLTFAASAIAMSLGTTASAQMDQQGLISLTCAQYMAQDANAMRTNGLAFRLFSGTDIDPDGQMDTTTGDTEVVDSSGTTDLPTAENDGATVLGTTEPTGDTVVVDSSGTTMPAEPTAMADMADDEVVPFILSVCEGQPDTLVVTALRTN